MVRFIIDVANNNPSATKNLHSNMVRFIMRIEKRKRVNAKIIYIPIWLDLL